MTLQKLTPNHDLQCYFFRAVGDCGAERHVGERVHGIGDVAAAVRLGGDRVESRQRVRTSGVTESAGRGFERNHADLSRNADQLHRDGFGFVPHGRAGRSCECGLRTQPGTEQVYQVPIKNYATAVAGSYNSAYANFTLSGTLTAGDFVGIAYLGNSITYQVGGWEGSAGGVLDQIVAAYATDPILRATRTGR